MLLILRPGWLGRRKRGTFRNATARNRGHLASDALEGRGVGTAGLDKAADYIAEQFARMGLRTNLFNGTPFQEFEIPLASEMGPAKQNRLPLVGPAG